MTQYLYEISIIVEDSYLCKLFVIFFCPFVVLTYMNPCLHLCEISNKSCFFYKNVFITEFFSKFLTVTHGLYGVILYHFQLFLSLKLPWISLYLSCTKQTWIYFFAYVYVLIIKKKPAEKLNVITGLYTYICWVNKLNVITGLYTYICWVNMVNKW